MDKLKSGNDKVGGPVPGLIVHEWIEKNGGAEKVLVQLAELLPDADILCLWNDDPGRFSDRSVRESVLARTPLRRHKATAVAAMPLVWRHFSHTPSEWAVISTHLFAHHVKLNGITSASGKYAYVHTPARYIWTPELDSRGRSLPARVLSVPFRRLDSSRAKELTKIAANSRFVAQRIETTWEREASVVYPPVAVERIKSSNRWSESLVDSERRVWDELPTQFVLGASRLVKYKMLDQVLRVGKHADLPVVIVGSGPDLPRLQRIAEEEKITCHFLGSVSDGMLYSLFQSCSFYVFPPIEDFGIAPVEAMAAGAVVMANREGGASESVIHGLTGALTDFSSRSEIDEALRVLEKSSGLASKERADEFSERRFQENLRKWVPEVFMATPLGKKESR